MGNKVHINALLLKNCPLFKKKKKALGVSSAFLVNNRMFKIYGYVLLYNVKVTFWNITITRQQVWIKQLIKCETYKKSFKMFWYIHIIHFTDGKTYMILIIILVFYVVF